MNEELYKREVEAVKGLGDQIGYGNMMDIASALWAMMLGELSPSEEDGAFYPVCLCQVKDGDLKEWLKQHRTDMIALFEKWEK